MVIVDQRYLQLRTGASHLFVRLITTMIFALAAVSASGQSFTAESIATSGSFNGQLYTNTALEFSILAPGGWNFWTSDQNKALVEKNRERAGATYDDSLKNSAANTEVLFQAAQRQTAGVERKAMFSCGVERLKTASTSEKYIELNKNLVLRTPGVKVTKDIYPFMLGGVKFSAFDVKGMTADGAYTQMYIAAVRKNAALFFVITLYDNTQDEIVEHSLRSIKFR